jgi:hypothetical protein
VKRTIFHHILRRQYLNVKEVVLQNLYKSKRIQVGSSRLEFEVIREDGIWSSICATGGTRAVKLSNKSLIRKMILENLKELRSIANAKESEYSYVSMLARLIDLLNPTHQFQATVLAYPLFGLQMLKRRLLSLDYDLGTNPDETFNLDNKTAVGIIKQMLKRLESDMRAYYEFSVPYKTTWTIGNYST